VVLVRFVPFGAGNVKIVPAIVVLPEAPETIVAEPRDGVVVADATDPGDWQVRAAIISWSPDIVPKFIPVACP
jgi:hypothetical protein